MQKKLSLFRTAASLALSASLLVLPAGALFGNSPMTVSAHAGEGVSGNDGITDGGDVSVSAPEPVPGCVCESRCGKYEYRPDCPICGTDYEKCAYKEPAVKITITAPTGWYMDGRSAKVRFSVEDILNTGNLAVKSVKAKVGQNGSYQDVSKDMYLEISENCLVYVLATDAHDRSYERSRSIRCFDTTKPVLNAAVSDGLLTIQALDHESGVEAVYVNGYKFKDVEGGTLNIRLSQFDAGYEYFAISAMDAAGNMSEVYKTENPYYKDPESDDDSNPAAQLPVNAQATRPSSAAAAVTSRTRTDASGNITSRTSAGTGKQAEQEPPGAEGKEFYTIEAASGKVFYLIIDRGGDKEKSYFLTEITERDLLNVTTDNSETLPKNSAALESLIPIEEKSVPNDSMDSGGDTYEVPVTAEAAAPEEGPGQAEDADGTEESGADEPKEAADGNPLMGYLAIGILCAAVIGTAYYFKTAKRNQDGDFVEDEDEYQEDEGEDGDGGYASEEYDAETDFFDSDDMEETNLED